MFIKQIYEKLNQRRHCAILRFECICSDFFKNELSLVEWLRQFAQTKEEKEEVHLRGFLGKMIFSGEEALKQCNVLSGGEKVRCMLSKMMMDDANMIIFDEPDNHLDLEAIVALGEALYNYQGNAICVSHDRELIDAFANRIIKLNEDGTVIDFEGGYEEFVEQHGH